MSNTFLTSLQSQRGGASGCTPSSPCNLYIACVSMTRKCGDDATMSRKRFIDQSFFDGGLVDEHYRNIVADWINALAFNAFQRVAIRFQLDLCLASWTREYFQEFLTDSHWARPF
jgi:hypothetical protein